MKAVLPLPDLVRALLGCLLVVLVGGPASAAPLRTLWVDHDSKGGPCSDSYSAADNAAAKGAKPWCTLGAAGEAVRAGDQVTVRGGTYREPMTSCSARLTETPGLALSIAPQIRS